MTLVRVAIVGRPNVGKSSLLNMLAKRKVSIVDPTPGVTRDRVTHIIDLEGPDDTYQHALIELTDTGGYGVYTAEGARFDDAGEDLQKLTSDIEAQIAAAVASTDLILFVTDAQAGITSLDQTVARLLRTTIERSPSAPDIIPIANKVDALKWEPHGLEIAALGFGEPWLVSAKNNYMRREFRELLHDAATRALPKAEQRQEQPPSEMKLALVGRRNAGKSSFVNALAGEKRVIVSEIAGTTRDSVDVRFSIDGRNLTAIDTAGVRKRNKFADRVEHFAFTRTEASIQRADVCLLLIDATQRITGIDKRLAARVAEEHKPCVITVTKWDLAQGRKNRKGQPISPDDYATYINKQLKGFTHAPIVFTSANTELGLKEAVSVAFDLHEQASTRLTTSKINRVIRDILAERGPSSKLGTRVKILYAAQVAAQPPTIVLVVNHPELFEDTYQRYMLNRLREVTPFTEIPIRLIIRERRRKELKEMQHEGRQRAREEQRLARPPRIPSVIDLHAIDPDDFDDDDDDAFDHPFLDQNQHELPPRQ